MGGGLLSAMFLFLNVHDLLSRLFSAVCFVCMCFNVNDLVFRLFSVLFAWVSLT